MLDSNGLENLNSRDPPLAADRRRYERIDVNLPGRYLLEDGTEHLCECLDVSVGGVRLRADNVGQWGSRVVAYIDGLGRVEGYIVRRAIGWFALEVHATSRKGERMQERIGWMLDSANAERRGPSRQFVRREVTLETADGMSRPAHLTDISKQGAALLTQAVYQVGDRLRLDQRDARVVRSFPGGVALAFDDEPHRAQA